MSDWADVTTVTVAAGDRDRLSGLLSGLRSAHADADQFDPHSTLEHTPTAAELSGALDDADLALLARNDRTDVVGYGLVHSWVEDDQTSMHLLDPWATPGPARTEIEAALYVGLEAAVRDMVGSAPEEILGANCRSTDPSRAHLLARLGFRPVFEMVEMELAPVPRGRSAVPPHITVRTARPDDAPAVAALTERVWAGRPYMVVPSLADVRRWPSRADPELFLLAEDEPHLVGLVSAEVTARHAEIDDVQVDPRRQRQGIATHLLTELVDRLRDRTDQPIRLHTEGHDPGGARSLYERLGFRVVATHRRYRKRLE